MQTDHCQLQAPAFSHMTGLSVWSMLSSEQLLPVIVRQSRRTELAQARI